MGKKVFIFTVLGLISVLGIAQEVMRGDPEIVPFDNSWDMLYFDEKSYYTCLDRVFYFYGFFNQNDPNSSHINGWSYALLFDESTIDSRMDLDSYYPINGEEASYYFEKSLTQMFTNYDFGSVSSAKVFYIELRYLTAHITKHTIYYNNSRGAYENIMLIARTFYPLPKRGNIYLDNNQGITNKTVYHNQDPGPVMGTVLLPISGTGRAGIPGMPLLVKPP